MNGDFLIEIAIHFMKSYKLFSFPRFRQVFETVLKHEEGVAAILNTRIKTTISKKQAHHKNDVRQVFPLLCYVLRNFVGDTP